MGPGGGTLFGGGHAVRDDAGHGVLPQWGDGKSDPALTDDELVTRCREVRPGVRDGLAEFFRKALHREPARRFDNAEEMRRRGGKSSRKPNTEDHDAGRRRSRSRRVAGTGDSQDAGCRPGPLDPCPQRPGAGQRLTVRNLLDFPIGDIHMMRGVGNQTRQEIIRFLSELRETFPTIKRSIRRPGGFRRNRGPTQPGSIAPSHRRRSQS